MSYKKIIIGTILVMFAATGVVVFSKRNNENTVLKSAGSTARLEQPEQDTHPLQITEMRKREYPGQ